MDRAQSPVAVSLSVMPFAQRLRDDLGAARVLLFGRRLRGETAPDTDYDVTVVAERFRNIPASGRLATVQEVFDQTVGHAPLHLTCLTPEEFDYARSHLTFVHAVLPEAIDLLANDALAQIGRIQPARPPALSSIEPAVRRFAARLHDTVGAEQVLLFGSQARGTAARDSDYDLIIVSNRFRSIPRLERGKGLREIFSEAGGRAPLDLICLTPEEFEEARGQITLVQAVLPEAIDLLLREGVAAS